MSDLPQRVQELISTPTREQLFKIVSTQEAGFTFSDVYKATQENDLEVSVTSVQNFLRALCYRGYLKERNIKETKSRGRSTIHYQRH
ncbi:MAG: transcriptional repressor [Cyclobacteriaceae bacterium]